MKFKIRPYHITDLSSLYRICLLTGYNGSDATSYLKDPDLIGHLFAAPYALFEPNLCFVLTLESTPYGYILGTKNSIMFYEYCEREWFPELRKRYPLPQKKEKFLEANFIRHLHQDQVVAKNMEGYPAHLHIDILPIAQRKGHGRKLIKTFLHRLKSQEVEGVHLIVNINNQHAINFYKAVGFLEIKKLGKSVVLGMKL